MILSLEIANALGTDVAIVFCQYDPADICKLSSNVSVVDCDDIWWAQEYDLRCIPNEDPF